MHAVGQHESSLCVSISDLNSESLSGTDDIQGSVTVTTHKVLGETDYSHYVYR